MVLAVELFAFFPVTRWHVCCRSRLGHVLMTIAIVAATTTAAVVLGGSEGEGEGEGECLASDGGAEGGGGGAGGSGGGARGERAMLLVYVSLVVFVTFACPLWLLSVQKQKLQIQGPWDIATIRQVSPQ